MYKCIYKYISLHFNYVACVRFMCHNFADTLSESIRSLLFNDM
jgi:hypothetical protein